MTMEYHPADDDDGDCDSLSETMITTKTMRVVEDDSYYYFLSDCLLLDCCKYDSNG